MNQLHSLDYGNSFHSGSYHSNSDFQEEYEENISGMTYNNLALVVSGSQDPYPYGLEDDSPYLYENQEVEQDSEESEEDPIDQNRVFNLPEVKVFIGEIICPICCHIIQNPINCGECDQNFCTLCIQKWFSKRNNRNCPCCRQIYDIDDSFSEPQNLMGGKVPKILINLLSKLLLTCKHKEEGCSEIVTYEFREKHEKQYCQFQRIKCPNQGCNEEMLRQDLEDHSSTCNYAKVICKYCTKDYLRMDIETHFPNCEFRQIQCEWCKEKVFAKDLNYHINECEFRCVTCQHCQRKFTLSQMKKHNALECSVQIGQQHQQTAQRYKELYVKTLTENNYKDQQIAQYQKTITELYILIEQLKQNKIKNGSTENQSDEQQLEEQYSDDFELEDEEQPQEIIEEDIQIEESLNQSLEIKKTQVYLEESTAIELAQQTIYQTQEDEESEESKQSQDDNNFDDNSPSITEIKLRGMYVSLLQRINDPAFKATMNWTEEDRKIFLQCFK